MFDDGLPALRDLLKSHDLNAKKSLGQNFLLDFNVTRKIARLANPCKGHHFVEVGPGPGGLTRALLYEGVEQLTVIERDERVRPLLMQIGERYEGKLDIIFEDAMQVDWAALTPKPYTIVGNLPYNIGTALLVNWLTRPAPPEFRRLLLMFQEEVANRIVANPRDQAYGRISALTQWRADAEIVYRLPRSAFTPPPKVNSAIVSIVPKQNLTLDPDVEIFSNVTAAAFGQRRKMLRQSLKRLGVDIIPLLDELGIDPTARAGELSWQDFCHIALKLN